MSHTDNNTSKNKNGVFTHRLDFYWQFIAVYAIALILYVLVRGSISQWTVTFVLADPLVILLCLFILGTAVGMLYNFYKKQEVIVGKDFIILRNRFREIKYTASDILKIGFSRERNRLRTTYRVIKIKVNTRRRIIRIRPMSFWDELELVHSVLALKKNIKK